MAQRTQMSDADHAKLQKEAAERTKEAAEGKIEEGDINHPMVDTMLTTAEHLGKIPGEPDKKQELGSVNLDVIPPEEGPASREAQEEIVQGAIAAAEERTQEAEAEAEEARSKAGEEPAKPDPEAAKESKKAAAVGKKNPNRKRFGKK